MPRYLRIALYILVPVIVLSLSTSNILQWMWMSQLGYQQVFWVVKAARTGMFLAAFLVAGVYLVLNARVLADELRWATFTGPALQEIRIDLTMPDQHRRAKRLLTVLALVLAFLFALGFYMQWDASLRFLWSRPFGRTDPIFERDIGFYMFQLPFWDAIQTAFTVLVFVTLAIMVLLYAATRLLRVDLRDGVLARPAVRRQIGANAVLWLVLLAWGLYLERYLLLLSPGGLVYGATYTDLHIQLPTIWIMFALALLMAAILVATRWLRLGRWIPILGLTFVVVWLAGRAIIPGLVQQFRVTPNELQLEEPFIRHNIASTRFAYGLHEVEEIEYEADDTLTYADILANDDAVRNIRLWDPRLLIQTYRQLQEIRTYYSFYSVDNDRYFYDGGLQQVMLASREISRQLPSQSRTWVNERLQYTHGYGLVMSPVTEKDSQGQPLLVIRDLPPRYSSPNLAVERPAIYYGEAGQGYYIVNSNTPELHYPSGDENVYHHYSGKGGIPIRTWFHRLLFAWELGDINILLSDYIHSESRLQIWRGVQERISRIAPFLELDHDPYLVLSEGHLYWIQDAYTTSGSFPYSQPTGAINYIRNSVKVVVDAYDGTVDFYVVDEEDPVLQVYASIFPRLFKPVEDLSDDLRSHFRYPQDLFEIQLERFNRYHMTAPTVFYNQEDLWTRPTEKYAGERRVMEPYYVLARLPAGRRAPSDEPVPGESSAVAPVNLTDSPTRPTQRRGSGELQFMLISPLTPENRDNMISWMAAKSDGDSYGELVVYKLPKQRLIYGPAQIDARIDQDPEISEQLALWDQRGSRVIRGNLMVIPIENSFIYVEPVFLIAEGVDIPQLQRVIVAIGSGVAMEPTIEEALFALFSEGGLLPEVELDGRAVPVPADTLVQRVIGEEMESIRRIWRELHRSLEQGNWRRYGELMEELGRAIEE